MSRVLPFDLRSSRWHASNINIFEGKNLAEVSRTKRSFVVDSYGNCILSCILWPVAPLKSMRKNAENVVDEFGRSHDPFT